ncbi:hypothetical protein A2344_01360 [Candidatus Peregrinibacteria bacterium RIFOXYB12_FULL_41_12]|nr:MAG: hypothetical protein A2244_03735 [Candidatus Peregrinibacteria bacterium RIFOXYA2_FULL_41_18]OGJ49197.1 MAG: hypothetical protein A2344_01360 [Candidatus Peregrinibacteria bacterium RIFOXYB12_FULL_41_12]OGJ52665.1 MAG: hypothetical protein A2448_01155 [Candidatus Peregrinibacteria bacterium RIFOXYC2_FULL_41_22]OGJ54071.1 MAG: hypothetical protein A2336_05420 [Candidatus Peregrinibacteria bacterium RIFOXYB2_FULL_41_88]
MKKTLQLIIVFLFFVQIMPSYGYFSDVNSGNQFYEAILYAQEEGIIEGYDDNTFRPDDNINRAEFVKIIIESILDSEEISGENCFPDVSNEWFAKYVCTAKTNLIIEGYPDGFFHPEYDISFVEAAKIILLGFEIETNSDWDIWYQPFIQELSDKNAIPTTITEIDKEITRGDMVEMIYRLRENILDSDSMIYEDDVLIFNDDAAWYQPTPETSWQWQLSGDIDTDYDVDMYDIDLFDTPQSVIDDLHSENKKVICYFSAGSFEEFRDDAEDFPEEVLGETLEGWEDEKWLDVSSYQEFASIMEDRLDLAVEKECDGVEPDNMDGYSNDSGFDLTYDDQIIYSKWIAEEAHERNLSVGLKNALDQIDDLVDYFDFAVNEQCFEYDECESLTEFIDQNKAVFGVEYELEPEEFCAQANEMDFSWLKMDYELDGGRIGCEEF